jgi:hypothetical protein
VIHVASNINVKQRNIKKLNTIELINTTLTRVVCKTICIIEVTIILNTIEKPNDNASIFALFAYAK